MNHPLTGDEQAYSPKPPVEIELSHTGEYKAYLEECEYDVQRRACVRAKTKCRTRKVMPALEIAKIPKYFLEQYIPIWDMTSITGLCPDGTPWLLFDAF